MELTGNSLTKSGEFVVGCNYWASHAGTNMWRDWQPEIVEQDLRKIADAGLQVLRIFPLWPDFQPISSLGRLQHDWADKVRFGESPLPDTAAGRAGVSEEALGKFEKFAEIADRFGLKLIVGLITGWMSGRLYIPQAMEACNVLQDPFAVMWQTRFVRHFVKHFLDCSAIIAWDMGNECNCLGTADSPEAAYVWTSNIAGAVRSIDRERPVISGMHGLSPHGTWRIEDQGELTDLLTTHPYPACTPHCNLDPLNTIRNCMHATAESRYYADIGGKPCIAEEFGTLGPMFGSDDVAADYTRTSLFSLWANNCHGLLWWCANDQENLTHAPYDWMMCERQLGLFKSDGTAKPVAQEMGDFRKFIESLPLAQLPERQTDAVCILTKMPDPWGAAYSSFILAKQAGFDIEFQTGSQPVKDAPAYLLPCLHGASVVDRSCWMELMDKVKKGATLYISMDNAILSHFSEFTGLTVHTRERRTQPVNMELSFLPNKHVLQISSEFKLNLISSGADALCTEADGNPVFTVYRLGLGKVYFLSVPLETYLANTPSAFNATDKPYWAIYKELAKEIVSGRIFIKSNPFLGLTEHALTDSEKLVVAINYSPNKLEDQLQLQDGWRIETVFRCSVKELSPGLLSLKIRENDGAVFLVTYK